MVHLKENRTIFTSAEKMFKDGYDHPLQFINSFYARPRWKNGKMVTPDALGIVYRDQVTGKKNIDIQYEPDMEFYMAYEDVEIPHSMRYIDEKLVEKCSCKFNDLALTLASTAGDDMVRDFYDTIKSSPYKAKKKYHFLPYVFNSDMDIEDFWIGKFYDSFKQNGSKITKGYYDIEVDGIDYIGFPDEHIAPCPINAITYVDPQMMTSYTYLLRKAERDNDLIKIEEDNVEDLKTYLNETLRDDFKYEIYFYDKELDLIASFYKQVNKNEPDFMLAWNQKFDALTLINRIKKLGGDPATIISHPDIPDEYKFVYFREDTKNQKPEDKSDSFNCSSYTTYMDQMLVFAATRKGTGARESFALSAIAREELNDDKLDYSDTSDIKTLPYDDYRKFVAYNIKDVFLLHELEKKNEDLDLIYSLAATTRSRINKAMVKTVSLKNLAVKFYKDQGYIMGNNVNIKLDGYDKNPDDDDDVEVVEKFDGAFVADPELNGYNGMLINGKRSKYIYQKVIDFDLSSLYPSIINAFNIDATTQYGRLFIDGIVPQKGNDPAQAFIDKLTSRDYARLGVEYYNLPSVTSLAREVINLRDGELE